MNKAFTTTLVVLMVNAFPLVSLASPSSPTADDVPFVSSKLLPGGASLVTAMRPSAEGTSILTYTRYDIYQNILARTTVKLKGDDVVGMEIASRNADGQLIAHAAEGLGNTLIAKE